MARGDRQRRRAGQSTLRGRVEARRRLLNGLELLESRRLLVADLPSEPEGSLPVFDLPASSVQPGVVGFLTGPSTDAPLGIALDYLRGRAPEWGLASTNVQVEVTDIYSSTDTGVTHIHMRQEYQGTPIENATVNVNVMPDGRILSVGGGLVSLLGASSDGTAILLGPGEAVTAAAVGLGLPGIAPDLVPGPYLGQLAGTYRAAELSQDDIPVRAVYVATAKGLRSGWELVLRTPDGEHWYDVTVDAASHELLNVADWVDHATYRVFPLPVESPDDGSRVLLTDPQDALASPFGWHDTNGAAGAEFTDTRGNNVSAQEDANADNAGGNRADGGPPLAFDFPLDLTQAPTNYQTAAITNLFYWNNVIHDIHYHYGFDEASGNFQVNNYGRGGTGGDAVQADAQDGSGINNANFATPPEGIQPRMQMYVFNLSSPNRDGDLDNEIIIHEYGHGVSNRLTGGPANSSALNAIQSGGMGEGWGDFWALMFLQKPTDGQLDANPTGTYVLNQPTNGPGIRRFPYSFDMAINPLTYGAFALSSEVHDTGEIWCSVLWDLNWLLINKHGYNSDLTAPYNTGGNNLTLQLVMDGLKLQPANPSFLDGRDAILAADLAVTGGANQLEIWTAFARRGMGASADDGGSANSTNVTEAFDLPSNDPVVTSASPSGLVVRPPTSVQFSFNEPIDTASFSVAADVASFTGPFGADLLSQITGAVWLDSQTLRIDFTSQPVEGTYTLTIGPQILAVDNGNPMDQDRDALPGEPTDDQFSAAFDYDPCVGPDGSGYQACAGVLEGIDLQQGAPGVAVALDGVDDGFAVINLGTDTFTFYGTVYTGNNNLFVSSNGLITFGSGNSEYSNANLTTSPVQGAIAPLWDDWQTDAVNTSVGDMVLRKFEDLDNDLINDRLIIEWSNVHNFNSFSTGDVTFQAILELNTGAVPGIIELQYPDLDLGDPTVDNGASATVGIKAPTIQGTNRLMVAFNDPAQPFLVDERAIRIIPDPASPRVTSITRRTPLFSPTNADTLVFRVAFSEPVFGLDDSDFVATGTTAGVTVLQTSPTTCLVTVSGGDLATLDGEVGLDIPFSVTIQDDFGLNLQPSEPPIDETYIVDNTAPTLLAFTRQSPASPLTNADALVFLATFDEAVGSVNAVDFQIVGATGVIAVSQVAPDTYQLTLAGGTLASANGVVGLNLSPSALILDLAGNPLVVAEPAIDEAFQLDNIVPTVLSFTRQTPATSPTGADTLVFEASFSEPVFGVGAADLVVTGTTGVASVVPLSPTLYEITISGGDLANLDATVGLDIAAGSTIVDAAGNNVPATEPPIDETYLVENNPPALLSLSRSNPLATDTFADSLEFLATFSEVVVGVDAGDFVVSGTTGSLTVTPLSGARYSLVVSGGDLPTYNGVVGIDLVGAPTIVDLVGNPVPPGDPAIDEIYRVDNIIPTTVSFIRQSPVSTPTNADTLVFLATFSEPVVGVDVGDFSVTGTTGAVVVTQLSGATYLVTVSGGDLPALNGTVRLNLASSPSISDPAGNPIPAGEPPVDELFVVDNRAPDIASIVRSTPSINPTNADAVVFRVTFSEGVDGVDAGDFAVTGTTATASVVPLTASVYEVTVSGGDLTTLNGPVGLVAAAAPSVADPAGNSLSSKAPSPNQTFVVDHVAPQVTSFTRWSPDDFLTDADSLTFLAAFSEPVVGVDAADFASAGLVASVDVIQQSPATYLITLSGVQLADWNGPLGLDLAPSASILDIVGNSLPLVEPPLDQTFMLDNIAPELTSIVRLAPLTSPTTADAVVFRATFSEPVLGVDATDFVPVGIQATLLVTAVSATQFDIAISPDDLVGFDGEIGLDLAVLPVILDPAGNATAPVEPAIDETFVVDHTPPRLVAFKRSIPSGLTTNADTLVFLATFSEPVTGVESFSFVATGATASVAVAPLSATTYEVTLSGGDLAGLDGTVGLDVASALGVADAAGNALQVAEPLVDETYTLDNVAPTAVAFIRRTPAASPTNADVLVFRATFSEPLVGVDGADFVVTGTTASWAVSPISSTVYDVSVAGGDLPGLDGIVGLDLAPGVTVTDVAGNPLSPVEPATDATFDVRNSPPTVSIFAVTSSQVEGDSGVSQWTFDVVRAGPATGALSVTFAVVGAGAQPATAADFGGAFPTGTISFADGETSQSVTIDVAGDLVVELDETFSVVLSNPTNGTTLGVASADATIVNDDNAVLSIQGGSVVEGNTGSRSLPFTISLSRPVDVAVTVEFSTSGGTATAPGDYVAQSNVVVTLAPQSLSATRDVTVLGDLTAEADETFLGKLAQLSSSGRAVTLGVASATGTITNDDSGLSATIDSSLVEGSQGMLTIGRDPAASWADPLPFEIHINDSTELSAPTTGEIPAGLGSVVVVVDAIEDGVFDGPQNVQVQVVATGTSESVMVFTQVVDVSTPFPWHNSDLAEDVNRDGFVHIDDIAAILQDIVVNGSRQLTLPGGGPPFVDVVPDNFVGPGDMGAVLSRIILDGEAEGEAGPLYAPLTTTSPLGAVSLLPSASPPMPEAAVAASGVVLVPAAGMSAADDMSPTLHRHDAAILELFGDDLLEGRLDS